jgi:hypothetical protein
MFGLNDFLAHECFLYFSTTHNCTFYFSFLYLFCKQFNIYNSFLLTVCPVLKRTYGMVKTCEKTEEVITCTLRCLPGYFPPNSTYSSENWTVVYQCSPFSFYTWNMTDVSPSCTSMKIYILHKHINQTVNSMI